jgi:hypothetical protein
LAGVKLFFWRIFHTFKISFVFLLAVISLTVYGVYKIWDTQYFLVKKYEIVGNSNVPKETIASFAEELNGKWIFFTSCSDLEDKIYSSSNYIKSVYVEKKLPDTINIHIEEREPLAVWRTVNGAYLIDKDGFILEKSVNEEVTLQEVLEKTEGDSFTLSEEENSESEETEESSEATDENSVVEEILDAELLAQIELEMESQKNEQNFLTLNFDSYNANPDSFKKYPQVKLLTDEIYETNETIDWSIWGGYSKLLLNLNEHTIFIPTEVLIFSEGKVLAVLENGKYVYFRLDNDVEAQVDLLDFVYGRLIVNGINFSEIDLRFKRPVIR